MFSDQDSSVRNIDNSRSIFYKDKAIVRFKDPNQLLNSARGHFSQGESGEGSNQTHFDKHDPAVKVVGDNGLMYILNKKANDPIWKNIDYIQTNIKVKVGCGFPYVIHFYANIEGKLAPDTDIEYDYK